MKERPILFSGPMVAAILAGRKTQTRRIVKPPRHYQATEDFHEYAKIARTTAGLVVEHGDYDLPVRCPYGKPGDRLWVKEGYRLHRIHDSTKPSKVNPTLLGAVWYEARGTPDLGWGKLRPSMFMPRWASRITLEITGIRVERLNNISEEDAKAEGLACKSKDGSLFKYGIADRDGLPGNDDHGWHWIWWRTDPRVAYRQLWEQINGCDSWYDNPWVWVVTFQRAKT